MRREFVVRNHIGRWIEIPDEPVAVEPEPVYEPRPRSGAVGAVHGRSKRR